MTGMEDGRTALYRFFDSDEQLLYVGITHDPKRRWKHHAKHKPWWPQVAMRQLEWLSSRTEAEEAERTAIRTELPIHNVREAAWPKRQSAAEVSVAGDAPFHVWLGVIASQAGFDVRSRGSQAALAREAGVAQSQLSRALQGKALPDVRTQKNLSRTLGISLSTMLIRSGDADPEDFAAPTLAEVAIALGVPTAQHHDFVDLMRRTAQLLAPSH